MWWFKFQRNDFTGVRLLAGAAGANVKKFKELTNQEFDDSNKDRNPSSY